MRFLELTTFQGMAIAIPTALAIIALYFLKHRRKRVVISSVVLWRKVLASRLENSIFEKLRRVVSILVAVAIGLLVALSIGRPEIEWLTGTARRSVIVLDTSPTMLARTADGKTRWQRAVETAHSLVAEGASGTAFRIADTAGQFDSPVTIDRSEIRKTIDRMHPVIGPARFPDLDAAPAGPAEVETQVSFITDGVSSLEVPAGVRPVSVFEPAANVGVTAFEVRSMPSAPLAYEAYLEVHNSGKDARQVEVTLSRAGQQQIRRNVRIAAGQSFREALNLSEFEGGGIRAEVRAEGDAFSADDVAYAYLPVKRRTKTLLVTRGNRLLEAVLKLDRLVDLSVTDPTGYPPAGDFDAFVFDQFAPAEPPARPALVIGAQNVPWLRESLGSVAGPTFESWAEDHPVMQHVSLFDVTVDRASRIDSSGLNVLASSRNTPLIVASERPRWIMLTFTLQASDFPYHAGFPLFVDNALAWFDRERLALRRAPGVVDVPMAGAQIRTIDGQPVPSRDHAGGTVFEAPEPGLYVAAQGSTRQYIAVNFANRQYSDVNASRVKETKVTEAQAFLLRGELWIYMLIGAWILVGVEWFTYHRRITL